MLNKLTKATHYPNQANVAHAPKRSPSYARHVLALALLTLTAPPIACAADPIALDRLVAAYPDQKLVRDGNSLIWPDGSKMDLDDGKGQKPFESWLENPDIEDTLALPYPTGAQAAQPPVNFDPGRARNLPFLDKMYGDCRQNAVAPNLKTVTWLPRKAGQQLPFNVVNGAAAALEAVSRDLDELPKEMDKFLFPAAGTYNCRMIAGTVRPSSHGHGIAIDIATEHTSYWRWSQPSKDGTYPYKNAIPQEIVAIFEKHGFIWGGRWYHYDTMHFEYRPELLLPARTTANTQPTLNKSIEEKSISAGAASSTEQASPTPNPSSETNKPAGP